jgi:hypothetical protein
VEERIVSALGPDDEPDPGFPGCYKEDYRLQGAAPGTKVSVTMVTGQFACRLLLIDGETCRLIDSATAVSGATSARLTFVVEDGVDYVIRATSWSNGVSGAYIVQTEPVDQSRILP